MNLVDIAIRLALEAHHGQVNPHDGEPYILHVHRVASNFGDATLDDQIAKAIAWLHDTVEDTPLTLSQIFDAFVLGHVENSTIIRIAEGVDHMTKRPKGQESNEDYYWRVKQNADATRVKIADLHDNFGRNYTIEDEEKRARLAAKYSLGFGILCRQT